MLIPLVAWRNLARRRYRTISMIGVLAVGISALMLIASLSTSIENTLGENVYDLLSSDITIMPKGGNRDAMIVDSESCIRYIENQDGVKAASPRIEAEGLISTGTGWRNTTGALVYGIDPENDPRVTSLKSYLVKGDYKNFTTPEYELPPIILGSSFLKESNLAIEDGDGYVEVRERIRITFGKLREVDGDITPIVMDFVIVGAYRTHLPYFDSLTVFIPIEQCRYLLDYNPFDPKANKILIKLDRKGDAPDIKNKLLNMLEEKTGESLRARTHKEYREHYLNDLIATTRPVGYLIVAVSLVSAILRMAHSSASAVQERIFDIGIMRAIGFKKKMVMGVYLLEAAIIGTVGGSLGIGVGHLIIYSLKRSPLTVFTLPLSELNLYPSLSFILGLLGLALGVGLLSVFGLLLKVLRGPSVHLIRIQ
ncbi:MAG: ABC transporter permease [Thermoplasmata archaeon]|nr:ABC transporter permease [Thermoplasmata archaeon]